MKSFFAERAGVKADKGDEGIKRKLHNFVWLSDM
jgi:hypothetical protein